jgi:hypothetical protein
MALGLRQIIIKTDGTVWKQSLSGDNIVIGSGANTIVKVSPGKIESGTFSYTFPAGDEYYQPQGSCGVYVSGDPAVVTGMLTLSAYTVVDVP